MMNRDWGLAIVFVVSMMSVTCAASEPTVDNSPTTRKLEHLARPKGARKIVTIYQFRSTVPEISAAGATDMFMTALIKSGHFAVAERERLDQGVIAEKQLNAKGYTTGNSAQQRLAGAQYIFEGAVTEANTHASSNGIAAGMRGLGIEAGGQSASIGLDVRIVDASNGLVIDSVDVRKKITQQSVSVSGIGSLLQSVTNRDLQGADADINHSSSEGVDKALRACIEEAVYQLAKRYGS